MVKTLDYRSPDSKEKADDQYAPSTASQLNHLEHESIPGYDRNNDGLDQLDPDNDNRTVNSDDKVGDLGGYANSNKNRDEAKNQEEDGPWKNSYQNPQGKREKVTLKNFFKKKGPAGLIIGLLLGGGGFMSVFSPGLLIIDMKEKMMNAFNDQLAVMDVRTTAMLKKKFKGTVSGVCSTKITIRCKFNSMSDKQLKKLEAVGKGEGKTIKVNTDGKTFGVPRRHKVTSIDFTDETGKVTRIDARNFSGSLQANPEFRGAMLKAYSSKLAGFADKIAIKKSTALGINRQKNITGKNDKERQKSVIDSANGERTAQVEAKVSTEEAPCEDGDGCEDGTKTIYKDDVTGETISQEEYDRRLSANTSLTNEFRLRKSLTETGGKLAKATLKGALTVTALGLGAVDSACTGYTLIRTVSFAAKYLGKLQLIRFAHLGGNEADAAKALLGDPDTMAYLGKVYTTTNSVGMSATDSAGYKYAAYGDVPAMPRSDDIKAESVGDGGNNVSLSEKEKERILLNDETTKYINGQLVGNGVMTSLIGLIGEGSTTEELDDTCSFVKSGWGQTILITAAVAGAVVAFFSGGLSLGWGAAAQVGASVAISVAVAMLTPKLIDMAAGTFIGEPELTNGNRAGNATVSGYGGYNDEMASGRGVPALQKEDAVEYQQLTKSVLAQYAEVDRVEHSPLDVTNSNTFMGSIASNLVPYFSKMSSLSGSVSSITQFATSSFTSLLPRASAADPEAQFDICTDPEYVELELAVDPFCNIKHGMKSETLAMDSDTVVDYMVDNNYIDEITGEPKDADNDYAKYIKHCMERTTSIGGFTEEDDNKGEECIQGTASGEEERKRNMFRLFFVDKSIDDGMENGMENSGPRPNGTENGPVKSPVTSDPTITSQYGPRGAVGGAANASSWHGGIDIVAQPNDVVAAMAGEVVSIGGTANTVTIKHADGLKTLYLHMYPRDVAVKVGDKVTAGQKIGKIGCAGEEAGICSGPHLHFNVWIDEVADKAKYSKYKAAPTISGNSAGKAINPANFLTDNGVTGYSGAVNGN